MSLSSNIETRYWHGYSFLYNCFSHSQRVCLKCGLRSRVKKCGRGSRNAGQLEENAATHLRLSEMRVAVAGREMRVTSRELRLSNVGGLGILWRTFVPL